MQDRCLRFLGGSSTATRNNVKEFLNNAGRRWWHAHEWRNRRATGHFSTLAPYSTGTATFTQGSTAVTGSGTTWATTHTGMTISLGYGYPEYVFTRTGATTGTLDRAYVEADATASAYVLYQDKYLLATTADDVLDDEMALHRYGYGAIGRVQRTHGEVAVPFPTSAGVPSWWSKYAMSSGRLQVRLGPQVPSTVFQVRYGYLSTYTDMSADGDECVVPERYRQFIVLGAMSEAYLLYQRIGEAAAAGQAFEARMAKEWARELAEGLESFRIGSVDAGASVEHGFPAVPVSYP